jgi:hypothetical protein
MSNTYEAIIQITTGLLPQVALLVLTFTIIIGVGLRFIKNI